MPPLSTASDTAEHFVLHGVSWRLYQALLKRVSDRRVFLTYYRGTLELMSPSYPHDKVARLLYQLVHAMAEELALPISSAGTATWRRKDRKVGLEADESFYLKHEPQIRGKSEIDLTRDPPPDLAIEVEISRRLGKRKRMYASIGIPEVWRYRPGHLSIHVLQPDGSYDRVDRSPTFPQVAAEQLAAFVERGLSSNESEWIKTFRAWFQQNLPGA